MTELTVTQQEIEKRQVRLTVTIPDATIDKALRAKAKKLSKQVRIPGFRPGKAPYQVVVQRLGREAMLQEVVEDMSEQVYVDALEQSGVEPYDRAMLEDINLDEPVTLIFDVPLKPVVDPGDYRSVRVDYVGPSEEDIQKDADEELKQLLSRHLVWVPVEGAVEFGDLVTIDIKLTVDGEVVLENDDWDIVPDAEEFTLTPEFDGQFIGMSAGESKSFTAAFPEDSETAWAGKEGHFEVAVKGVKREEMPELDDELAASIGEYESADALRQAIHDHVAGHAQEHADEKYMMDVFEAALAQAKQMEYPDAAIERQIDRMADEQEALYQRYGIKSLEELLQLQRKSMQEFREELRQPAEETLKRDLLIGEIVEREQIPVNDYELEQFFGRQLGGDQEAVDRMMDSAENNATVKAYFTGLVKHTKGVALMLAIARGEEVPEPGQHVSEEAPIVEEEEMVEVEVVDAEVEEVVEASVSEEAEEMEAESEADSQPESNEKATLVE
ncbi:MAG: trigger factor [Caldilineales bacterium]|nr:trigger factor [Caldilineales bacterium]